MERNELLYCRIPGTDHYHVTSANVQKDPPVTGALFMTPAEPPVTVKPEKSHVLGRES
jgi:hypothetical protein